MSITLIDTYATAAISALDDEDYAGAIAAANKARILLATSPDLQRSAGGNAQQMGWTNVQAIEAFVADVRRLQSAAKSAASGPFQQTKVRYARTDD